MHFERSQVSNYSTDVFLPILFAVCAGIIHPDARIRNKALLLTVRLKLARGIDRDGKVLRACPVKKEAGLRGAQLPRSRKVGREQRPHPILFSAHRPLQQNTSINAILTIVIIMITTTTTTTTTSTAVTATTTVI